MVETLNKIHFEKEFKTLKARSPIASQVKFLYPEIMASPLIDLCTPPPPPILSFFEKKNKIEKYFFK